MATDPGSIYDDEWVDNFARQQRRRNYALGLAILFSSVFAALFVFIFLMETAPTTWML